MKRRFVTLDVFTNRKLSGNPLAVVLDAEGLDNATMQAIANEFNLSETVFVLPDEEERQRAVLRIFTPARELPFAGHPTVGTAFLLASLDLEGQSGEAAFGLSEKVGTINCAVSIENENAGFAQFRLPRLPQRWGEGKSKAECAWALGLEPRDIGFENHEPSRYGAGSAFDLIPIASLEALARATTNSEAFDKVFSDSDHPAAYLYCRDGDPAGKQFRARMFGLAKGIIEDPATGSAAAALSGALMQFEPMGDGDHIFTIGQGFEMGRPSEISLRIKLKQGAMDFAEIGGHAVIVGRGELQV